MRMAKPGWENSVLRDPVQHTVRSDDRRVDRTGKHQSPNYGDESTEGNAQPQRSDEIHCKAADRIVVEIVPDVIRNDHHGKKCNAGGEDHAVQKDDKAGFFEVTKLWVLD